MSGPLLATTGLCVPVGGRPLLENVDLAVAPGEVLALLGPNGAGKTTLLKALLGLLPHSAGRITVAGHDLAELSQLERARQLAYVPQTTLLTAQLSGREVVAQGRYAHRVAGSGGEAAVIAAALARTDCGHLADRPFAVCSGGERARLLLARALATDAPVLLLDEPTASLDIAHALHFFALLRELAQSGHGIVVVLHQIGDALRWADRALVLDAGRCRALGPVQEVLHEELIAAVFGVRLRRDGYCFELPDTERPA